MSTFRVELIVGDLLVLCQDTPSQSTETPIALPAAMPPKLSLAEFCSAYKLSESIETVLSSHRITGPHALRFVTDSFLLQEMHLMMGELADIRCAEESWQCKLRSALKPAPFPAQMTAEGHMPQPPQSCIRCHR
ncbi:hypothetical protein BD410DRAFT_297014 [Rickenella mellea]|uniref:Uncharacterized protein n=1 Tax=Rickenella mellea TaxID=50990 RepID=A0A4Y7Q1Q0_9AGAM|nr:hypothetical protein BD410DRAFT_297014 [Rickenella mellea]